MGGAEVTMEELVELYAMLANGGMMRPARRLVDGPQEEGVRLLSPEASFITMEMLGENPRARATYPRQWTSDDVTVYWKTGTSFSFRDAWSVGVFGPYVLA
ncbi:MAG: penicillin-binding protein 1C, partial [Thermoplasmata archaeon]|nr:penicillin-binding protein 1C [Thermoplasmata archaeon]